jgi:hypothetical protein
MRPRRKLPVFMDPAERYPVGSSEWAGRISSRAWAEYGRADICGFRPLVKVLQAAVPGRPWLAWPPETPWGSVDIWSKELFGQGWSKLLAIVRPIDPDVADRLTMIAAPEVAKKRGRPTGDNVDQINIRNTGGGTSSSYLAARLKRDRPDLAEEVQAGRMSVRAAAREAKILKPPDPGRRLERAWDAATPEQRAACVARKAAAVHEPDGLERLRQAWRDTWDAWHHVSEDERAAFMADHPDEMRQLRQLLDGPRP